MQRLVEIIGPAPSEIPFKEFVIKLTVERDRVRRNLLAPQLPTKGKKSSSRSPSKKTTKKAQQEIGALMMEAGISQEELEKLIAEEVKKK